MLPKRHLIQMINKIGEKAFSQKLSPMASIDFTNFAVLKVLGLTWLPSCAPGFYLNSKQVNILSEPRSFYELLLEQIDKAQNRIVLASLYLGNGPLEKKLVKAMSKRLAEKPGLKIKILLDCIRGSRGKVNSREMLLPLLENYEKSCEVSLYQTPSLKRGVIRFLPEKYREIISLQHMKVYIFDCNCIITGANLSNDYFTQRQDRYMFIQDCKEMSDFIDGLVGRVSEFSFSLNGKNELTLNKNWSLNPSKSEPKIFYSAAAAHIRNYYESFIGNPKTDENDTIIFPLVEIGPFDIHVDSTVTMKILKECDKKSFVHLTTGYFNLTEAYTNAIINNSKAQFRILMAHPTANGFYKAKGPAGGIPHGYTDIALSFLKKVAKSKQTSRIKMSEYKRKGWTYHAKGLWLSSFQFHPPFLTMIGSPNFGERSLKRDLECQFLLATLSQDLQNDLSNERGSFFDFSHPFTEATELEPERKPPLWVKLVVWLFKDFF